MEKGVRHLVLKCLGKRMLEGAEKIYRNKRVQAPTPSMHSQYDWDNLSR